jgi:hypothetical protein
VTVFPPDARPEPMSEAHDSRTPPDVALLLRAHAEQRWLSREVIPVLRQIETRERLPEEQLPAALAYLEMIWSEARRRARATDATCGELVGVAPASAAEPDGCEDPAYDEALCAKAHSYHAAVLTLRHAVRRRVAPLLAPPTEAGCHAPHRTRS